MSVGRDQFCVYGVGVLYHLQKVCRWRGVRYEYTKSQGWSLRAGVLHSLLILLLKHTLLSSPVNFQV